MDAGTSEHAKTLHAKIPVERLNYAAQSPELFKKLADLSTSIRKGSIEASIIHLVEIRASQINGCSFLPRHACERGKTPRRARTAAISRRNWHESLCSSHVSALPSPGRKRSPGCLKAAFRIISMSASVDSSPRRNCPT